VGQTIVEITDSADEWQSHQSHVLRSVQGSKTWLLEQLGGGFMRHISAILQNVSNVGVLERCGFTIPCLHAYGIDADNEDGEILRQDELAELLGTGSMVFASKRLARCLWLVRGWPYRMTALTDVGSELATTTMDAFKRDLRCHRQLQAEPANVEVMTAVLRRSTLAHTSVQQYVEALACPFPA
jgi:hypothetical protein